MIRLLAVQPAPADPSAVCFTAQAPRLLLEGDLGGNASFVSHDARDVALAGEVFGKEHVPRAECA